MRYKLRGDLLAGQYDTWVNTCTEVLVALKDPCPVPQPIKVYYNDGYKSIKLRGKYVPWTKGRRSKVINYPCTCLNICLPIGTALSPLGVRGRETMVAWCVNIGKFTRLYPLTPALFPRGKLIGYFGCLGPFTLVCGASLNMYRVPI